MAGYLGYRTGRLHAGPFYCGLIFFYIIAPQDGERWNTNQLRAFSFLSQREVTEVLPFHRVLLDRTIGRTEDIFPNSQHLYAYNMSNYFPAISSFYSIHLQRQLRAGWFILPACSHRAEGQPCSSVFFSLQPCISPWITFIPSASIEQLRLNLDWNIIIVRMGAELPQPKVNSRNYLCL